jgi:acetyltransferase-like isoleucine patch superfamily enzyme
MFTFGLLPGCIKKCIYRLEGNLIGRHVKIHIGAVIVSKNKFCIDDNTEIGFFSPISGQNICIGKRCKIRSAVIINATNIQIGNEVTISETTIIRAGHLSEKSQIIIDDLVHIFPHTTIDPSRSIHLEEECAVGPGCSIFTHGSYKNILEGYPVTYGDVTIGKRVELTYNVFVAPSVNIGDDAVIAYGSYVNCNIPSEVLAAGCPAKVKRTKEQFAPTPSEGKKEEILTGILNDFEKHLAFIGLDHNSDDIRLHGISGIVAEEKYHFDLTTYHCNAPQSRLSKELHRFLSRYGIRFKITE